MTELVQKQSFFIQSLNIRKFILAFKTPSIYSLILMIREENYQIQQVSFNFNGYTYSLTTYHMNLENFSKI
jgi:hypothetical protein